MADKTLVLASDAKWLVVVRKPTVSAAAVTALVGPSNYQLAVQQGYSGTMAQWLESLKGEDAYQLAVDDGFVGSRADWQASLVGPANTLTAGTATTGAPGSDMSFEITGDAPHQTLNLTVPRGDKGDPGTNATVAVVSTTTGAPGTDAAVINEGTDSAVQLAFTIPRGDKGDKGEPGVVQSIAAGTGIDIDASDPANPKVSATNTGSVTAVQAGTGISVDATNPAEPSVSLNAKTKDLTDVSDTDPTDGQVRTWDAASALWVPTTPSTGGGDGTVKSVVAGTGIAVDDTDPANPVVSATAGSPDEAARLTATATTASIANGASGDVQVVLSTSYRLLSVQTSQPARVRIYETEAARTADASRAVGTDPGEDSGLILEYVTVDTDAHSLSPVVTGASLEATPSSFAPMSVTNLGTDPAEVTVTLVWEPATGVTDRPTMALFKVDGTLSTGIGTTLYPNITGAPWRIVAVITNVETAPSGGTVTVDVNIDGSSIFTDQSKRPVIADGQTSSGKLTDIDVTTIPDGSNVTVDIDTATAPAANLTVALLLADGSVG